MRMTFVRWKSSGMLGLLAVSATLAMPAQAELSAEELAKMAQNPVGNLISVPFQDNVNLNVGPEKSTQNVLNIQPVIPIDLNADWNIITRTIIPVISQPAFEPWGDRTDGIGDIQFTAFLSPANANGWIWGVGPIVQLPTNSNDQLGNDRWGLGPSFVVLHLAHGDPWVYGALTNNVWSVGSGDDAPYNNFLLQPFFNYNFPCGLYLVSAPVITANWKADDSDRWTVPLGGGVGKIFHLGKLPVNTQFQAFYNVVTPDDGPNWTLRLQVQFMFPK
ncbi:MAG TPA: neuromedin U [Candidatus Competibacteraceae bacterium]|nr:neuromedin U [Candidatus Competibacteraceae bacterium]HQA25229.1 neuromedin U [Candidatus Competibacteraceae bacterium]HQD56153.1 neuromedin U [Candidatus Competibacteraceae bacterium]